MLFAVIFSDFNQFCVMYRMYSRIINNFVAQLIIGFQRGFTWWLQVTIEEMNEGVLKTNFDFDLLLYTAIYDVLIFAIIDVVFLF